MNLSVACVLASGMTAEILKPTLMTELKKFISAFVVLIFLCGLAAVGRIENAPKPDVPGMLAASPAGIQPLHASILKPAPASFTLNTRKFSNIGMNDKAPELAIFTTASLPRKCGDFRDLDLHASEPVKYERRYDLKGHEDVIEALTAYGCILVRN